MYLSPVLLPISWAPSKSSWCNIIPNLAEFLHLTRSAMITFIDSISFRWLSVITLTCGLTELTKASMSVYDNAGTESLCKLLSVLPHGSDVSDQHYLLSVLDFFLAPSWRLSILFFIFEKVLVTTFLIGFGTKFTIQSNHSFSLFFVHWSALSHLLLFKFVDFLGVWYYLSRVYRLSLVPFSFC